MAQLKRLFNAKKVGHAGTLDPLASGVLPVAFGEATKTVPIVQDGTKSYGSSSAGARRPTPTTPKAGWSRGPRRAPAATRSRRRCRASSGSSVRRRPPIRRSRVAGERAYDLARSGETFDLAAREIVVHRLTLAEARRDEARFEAECGKGAYIRALARDLGRVLGCGGHVVVLRRTRVGPFQVAGATPLDALDASPEARATALAPIEAGLAEMPRLVVDRNGAAVLRRGQKLLLRGAGLPPEGPAYAACFGAPIAYGAIEGGYFVSTRVFNPPL